MISMIGSLYTYRSFILRSAWSELRNRYAGSGIGFLWNFAVPLVQIAIYAVVFSTLMGPRVAASGLSQSRFAFVLYLCSGMLPWLAFADCISRGTNALVRNSNYLRKMGLPESIFIAQSAVVGLLTAAISLVLLFVVGWPMGLSIGWSYLLLPAVLVLFQGLSFGVSLTLSTLNVLFRDVGQAITLLLPIWMWLTPIVYSETVLPPVGRALLRWNPAYGFITAFRDIFLHNQVPAAATWGMMLAWVLVSVAVGGLVLSKLRFEVRDML